SQARLEMIAKETGLDTTAWKSCLLDNEGQLQKEIQMDIRAGQKLGVNGTPAFFINGIFINGAQPIEAFDEIIQKELKN
ncbi:MAG: oxidoreductase, partial [Cyclobacteriaceae bacterium]|nr:oxidoreductase [Cyclobacteriaceae bacterium]